MTRIRTWCTVRATAAAAAVAMTTTPAVASPAGPPRARPRLVVIMVVDQMRADYVDRYGHQWTAGLKRLTEQGASFKLAAYPYLNTVTCAGHATIGTGAFPRSHGVILNEWWDRSSGTLQPCTDDANVSAISYGKPVSGGHSAWALRLPTLADEMRAQLPVRPRVVSISLKPRSAIMPAGRRADAILWFDDEGEWATSTAYAAAPVPFVQRVVAANPLEKQFEMVWTRALDASAYLFEDASAAERPPAGWTTIFPHPLAGDGSSSGARHERWDRSPFSDDYIGLLVEAAIDELKLGQGPGTDYLAVSFSALDRVGHRFGPRSHEVQDTLVRLDRTIGRLLDHLDRAVGRDQYALALTADHGVSPIAEQIQAEGLPAARLNPQKIGESVNKVLETRLGPGPHVARMQYTDLYFAPGVYDRVRANPQAMQAAIDALLAVEGVWRVFRSEDLAAGVETWDLVKRAAALSYVEGRSGDLIVVPKPYFSLSSEPATHGTAHQYDTRVPIILFGAGIRPGEYLTPATPADIAPTLAFLAGVTMSAAEGRVLGEALDTRSAASSPAGANGKPASNNHRDPRDWR